MDLDARTIALRSQDIYSGLQTIDQTSGIIASDLRATRITGMAATVAANIRGIDVIKDPHALEVIASQQWGIDSLILPSVLDVLEEVGYITRRRGVHGRVAQIDERVPLLHGDMYATLGEHWASNDPTEVDGASIDTLEMLASAPMRVSDLEKRCGDQGTVNSLLTIGEAAQFVKRFRLVGGEELLWSPFCAYENPEALGPLFERFDDDAIRSEFQKVRRYQGLPLTGNAQVLNDAVGHGILIANSIEGSGGKAKFAFLPYQAKPEFRQLKKIILDKALILLACVRYGENFAVHPIKYPGAILRKLLEPGAPGLRASTEAATQYLTAALHQILRLESIGGGWHRAALIDTPDNIEAVHLALDLLQYGEAVSTREDPEQRLLYTDGRYLAPLRTIKETKAQARTPIGGCSGHG